MRFQLLGRIYTIPKWIYFGLIILVIVSVAAVGRYWMRLSKQRVSSLQPIDVSSPVSTFDPAESPTFFQTPTPPVFVAVYLTGEVTNPGVYWVEQGGILTDVVELAGGLTPAADTRAVNLALRVEDGMHIHVPKAGEPGGILSAGTGAATSTPGKVNINTADKETLMTLSGIGESTALDIIQYRTENGGFQTIEELMNVPGIKEARYNKIKDGITV